MTPILAQLSWMKPRSLLELVLPIVFAIWTLVVLALFTTITITPNEPADAERDQVNDKAALYDSTFGLGDSSLLEDFPTTEDTARVAHRMRLVK